VIITTTAKIALYFWNAAPAPTVDDFPVSLDLAFLLLLFFALAGVVVAGVARAEWLAVWVGAEITSAKGTQPAKPSWYA